MFRHALFAIGLLLGVLGFADLASAQAYNLPGSTSQNVSPYLNLLTMNGFGVTTAYQSLIQPMEETKRLNQSNGAQLQGLQGQANSRGRGQSPSSRHYMNYSHYYIDLRR